MDNENTSFLESNAEARDGINKFVTALRTEAPTTSVSEFGAHYFGKNNKHSPLVFAGPSGVGKGTLVNLLMTRFPETFGFSVSHTTRQPRYRTLFHMWTSNV